jgi:undecaprenyl pyrophosphate synthase
MHEHFAGIIKPGSREAKLLDAIDPARLPRHIAVIMDGNGRGQSNAEAENFRPSLRARNRSRFARHYDASLRSRP